MAGATAGAVAAGVVAVMPGAAAASTEDRIAFVSSSAEIFTIRPDDTDLRQLTANAAWDTDPAWSPDGTKIAFSSNRDGDDDIWLMDSDGTNPVNLTNSGAGRDVQPAWSRNGSSVVFVRDGVIHQVPAAGGTIVKRVRGTAPSWSPVEAKIAFVRDGDVYVMNPDGSGVAAVTSGEQADHSDWSPDGTKIAFQSESPDDGSLRIKIIELATRAVGELPGSADVSHPSWSPDGTALVFSNVDRGALVIAPADGSSPGVTLLPDLEGYEVLPSWSGCIGTGCDTASPSPSESTSPTEGPTESPSPTETSTDPDTEKTATEMSLRKFKLRYRIKAVGSVTPEHPGAKVRVVLAKRKSGQWKRVARRFPTMDDYGRFVTRFKYPAKARRCRIKAVFPGDDDHLRSAKAVRFRC